MNATTFENEKFDAVNYTLNGIGGKEYDCCVFNNCNFEGVDLSDIIFSECEFTNCNISNAKLKNTGLKDVKFINIPNGGKIPHL